jgi:glycosyltransferase involved in cell wall biosynthesis
MQITHDLAIGGLQQVVVNLCRNIDRDKFDISVLCLRHKGEFSSEIERMGIKVIEISRDANSKNYFNFLKVSQILRAEKIDIVHTHNIEPFIDGTIGSLLSGVKNIVHTDHARQFPDKKRYMFQEWLMSHFAYKIVGVSEHTAENLIKYEKISRKKIMVISNGIDGEQFEFQIDKEKKKSELGIKNNGLILGLGVRLTDQKGISYLIKAMATVVKEIPDINLLIAGEGPLKESLEEEAASLGVGKNVLFLGPRLDIPELLKLFDLYVLPSLWEGLPMVLLEALAAGCPILATDVGGNSTAIKNGVNGSLVEAESSEKLANEIVRLCKNEDIRKKYSENGKKIFLENFTSKIMTERYEKLYLG